MTQTNRERAETIVRHLAEHPTMPLGEASDFVALMLQNAEARGREMEGTNWGGYTKCESCGEDLLREQSFQKIREGAVESLQLQLKQQDDRIAELEALLENSNTVGRRFQEIIWEQSAKLSKATEALKWIYENDRDSQDPIFGAIVYANGRRAGQALKEIEEK